MSEISALKSVAITQVLRDIRDQVDAKTAKQFEFWARNATRNLQKKQGLKEMHERVGQQARSAALEAYKLSGLGQRPSYRQNDRGKLKRYSNGRMEMALQDESIVYTDEKGIKFIDKSKMDRYAKQWYRLNFGTEGRGSNSVTPAPIEIFGIKSNRGLSLNPYGPSVPFKIPAGIWSGRFAAQTDGAKLTRANGFGRDAFYANRKKQETTASPFGTVKKSGGRTNELNGRNRGIRGVRYLDAGTQFLNRVYGRELEDMVFYWLKTDRKK